MAASMELNSAKKNLTEVLGDSMKLYLQILKSWFRQKMSRDDFDHEARKLLPSESVHLHNQFLLAILTKCQTVGASMVQKEGSSNVHAIHTTPQKPKKSSSKKRAQCPRVTFHQRFIEVSSLIQVPLIQPYMPEPEDRGPGYVSREMLLPDVGLIHGRTICMAWDYGLEDVEDDVVRLLLQALEIELKNILSVVLCRRNGYHLREKRFRCNYSAECPPAFLQNSTLVSPEASERESTSVSSKGVHMPALRPSLETGVRDASVQLAMGGPVSQTKENITLFNLFDALQVHKSVLPSHSIYSQTMERISNLLNHPSNEELTQDDIHRQEVRLKRELHTQQAVFRA